MACADPSNVSDGKTCLCCLCRCGDHKCLQQMALKLPLPMQFELESKRTPTRQEERERVTPEPADLYSRTTYRTDFCEQRDLIDEFPLEQKGLVTSLKVRSGRVSEGSTYKADFTPWSPDEQELCRGKLHVPDHLLDRVPEDGRGERCAEKVCEKLYNYYCPPHCVGVEKEEPKENCLTDFREKFNIGPPRSRKNKDVPVKPRQPFTKFTNYSLDYRGGPVPPRQEVKKSEVPRVEQPMESDTSYRRAYPCPPDDCFARKPKEDRGASAAPRGALKTSREPMQQDTTSMLDYKDPEVAVHKPVGPPRQSFFRPPSCPMESETTTATSYPRWTRRIQNQGHKKSPECTVKKDRESDVRRLVTTYQEDFDGLNRALCPCTVVESYGPRVLEPRFCPKEPDDRQPHEFFGFDRSSDSTNRECPH